MADNVTRFEPHVVGEGYRFDADDILEGAKGQGLTIVSVIAEDQNGELWVSGSANAGETLILLERAKHHIVFGDES